MLDSATLLCDLICHRLQIEDFQFVEIESKKRVLPRQAKELTKYLTKSKKVDHVKSSVFFDQFLDTPQLDLLKAGASMRIRYKGNGSKVYLQYKGPGFIEDGLLYRSEFSSKQLKHLLLEESHHDIIRFTKTSVSRILAKYVDRPMAAAMRLQLGARTLESISVAPIIGLYQKEKFIVELAGAFLEPSVDRVFAFHINKAGLHPLSTFCEYENEVKAPPHKGSLKLGHIETLLKFDAKVTKEFDLKPERLDKYHRCASIFLPEGIRASVGLR